MSSQILEIIENCVRDIREEQELDGNEEINAETQLFGDNGMFDSVGLVSLVVAVEEAIEDEYDAMVSLADQKAMSQKNSPYRTVGALAEYAGRLIQEES